MACSTLREIVPQAVAREQLRIRSDGVGQGAVFQDLGTYVADGLRGRWPVGAGRAVGAS
jgi:hypothetical protein